MLDYLWHGLQIFAEGDGADGGTAAEGSAPANTGEDDVPAFIPEKAKRFWKKASENQKAKGTPMQPSEPVVPANEQAPARPTYAELIKSDEYREEHEKYMQKTIADRLKKYKGQEESYKAARSLLDIVGAKYDLDPNSETYMDDLAKKVQEDDSYYENYAMEHDMTPAQARQIVSMERRVKAAEEEEAERDRQEQIREHMIRLQQNAEKTKAQFPGFDLETEMQNENFRRLCAATNGDTTAAFTAVHWNEIMNHTVQTVTNRVQAQTAATVAANKARPVEAGLSYTAPAQSTVDFRQMSLKELRAYAEQQRNRRS